MIVESTPSTGGSARARMLFQTLLASAQRYIEITTPYFLPDKSVRDEIICAINRGVDVKIIAPGKHNDHLLTRRSAAGFTAIYSRQARRSTSISAQ